MQPATKKLATKNNAVKTQGRPAHILRLTHHLAIKLVKPLTSNKATKTKTKKHCNTTLLPKAALKTPKTLLYPVKPKASIPKRLGQTKPRKIHP